MRVRLNSDSLKVFICICFYFLLANGSLYAESYDNKPNGGTITTTDPTEICIVDDILDVVNIELVDNVGDSSIFVLTSDAGVILKLSTLPTFNLTGADSDVYRIIHIGYDEFTIGPRVGLNIKKLKGWFGLSNEIVLNLLSPFGGFVRPVDEIEQPICVSDGESNIITLQVSSERGDSQGWVIADSKGIITQIFTNPEFDLEGSGAGLISIHHYSSFGDVQVRVGQNINRVSGCIDFSRAFEIEKIVDCGDVCDLPMPELVVRRTRLEGNTLDSIFICFSDNIPDLVAVSQPPTALTSRFVLLDSENVVLQILESVGFLRVNHEPISDCQIVLFHFLNEVPNIEIGVPLPDFDVCFASSRRITIIKQTDCGPIVCDVQSGTIAIANGADQVVCTDDGIDDMLEFTLTGNTGASTWIVTDVNGVILRNQNSPIFNFEGITETCIVRHISLRDPITNLGIGENINNITGCFEFSNPITITKQINCGVPVCNVIGGLISANGQTEFTICVDDGEPDIFTPIVGNNIGESFWIITDTLGDIMLINRENLFNLEGVGEGICQLWHFSAGEIVSGFQAGSNVSDIVGCFDLSNPITITREINCGFVCDVDGGAITFENGNTDISICVEDPSQNTVNVTLTGNSGPSTWLVADLEGNIISIQNSPVFVFDDADVSICQIWHLSLIDPITGFGLSNNLRDIEGCFDLSNPITVTKQTDCFQICDVQGGSISFGGLTQFNFCADDGLPDDITPTLSDNSGISAWLLINTQGEIIRIQESANFQFEGSSAGTFRITHISYNNTIGGLNLGDNIANLSGCFDLSNQITIVFEINCGVPVCDVSAGMIDTGGDTAIDVCLVDSVQDIVNVNLSGNIGSSIWLVTDQSGNITTIQNDPNFDFTNADLGICFIRHMSLQDPLTGFAVGGNISDIAGCFELSNSIQVNKIDNCGAPVCDVIGGNISIGGETTVRVCVVDMEADIVNVTLSDNRGSSTWLVTDNQGNILQIQNSSTFDFTNNPIGSCSIWHLSLTGTLGGFAVGSNINQLAGCFSLSNPVTINRIDNCGAPVCDVLSGNIAVAGETTVSVCIADIEADIVNVTLSDNRGSSTWIVTDTQGNILQIQNSASFDFTNNPIGSCSIYHLSLTGSLDGFAVGSNINQLAGCFSLSNPVTVNKIDNCGAPVCDVLGGNIAVAGETTVSVCIADIEADIVNVTLSDNRGSSTWIVTDTQGNILQIQNSASFDFTNNPIGSCSIYHLSLTGSLDGFAVGSNINQLAGCFSLSNPVTVNKIDNCGAPVCDVEGGTITLADGSTSIQYCTSDGVSDVPRLILENNQGSSTWLATNSDGVIIEVNPEGIFNFEGTPAGTCFVYHLSIQDPFSGFAIGANIADFSGCFELSNSIQVSRITDCGPPACDVVGGVIASPDGSTGLTICVDDGLSESIEITLSGNVGPSTWVITDTNGQILQTQNTNVFSFEGSGEGVCLIYHLSLDNTITGFTQGELISNFGGCFSLSNAITVTKQINCGPEPCIIDGGDLTMADGTTTTTICTDDDLSDVLDLVLTGNVGATAWILTDDQGIISDIRSTSDFNFEGDDAGTCFVYHISLFDPITGFAAGVNISGLGGCFELSNPITVNKITGCGPETCMVDGGVIMTADTMTVVDACVTDGINENIELVIQGGEGARLWVVTDSRGEILTIQVENVFNFEGTEGGTNFVYNIAILDPIGGFDVGNNLTDIQGCFDLSNPVTINKLEDCTPIPLPVGGSITAVDGTGEVTDITICVDDGMSDRISVILNGSMGESTYIVTDSTGQILIVQAVSIFEFEGSGGGAVQIFHVASFGDVVGLQAGLNIADITGNFQLSNQINVFRQVGCGPPICDVDGGSIETSNNETFLILCVTDAEPDIVNITLDGNSGTSSYLVTDPQGNITLIQNDASVDFSNTAPGRCFIYHISSDGDLENFVVGQNITSINGCFALSNTVEISKIDDCEPLVCDDIMSGTISTMGGDTEITVCVDDGINEDLVVDVVDNVGGSIWITTDANDIILSTQNNNVFNFEGDPTGQCFVRHIAALDALTGLILGNSVSDIEGCFQISNRLAVTRELCSNEECVVSGGAISIMDVGTEIEICVTDNMSDQFVVDLNANTGISQWIVADSTGIIIGIQDGNDNTFDFESSSVGMCRIWHISTRDSTFNLNLGMDIANLEGCHSLSNAITVTRLGGACSNPECAEVLSGFISLMNGEVDTTLCIDDGMNENLVINLTGNTGAGFFILSDDAGVILDLENDPLFNFEGSDIGECFINYASILDPFGGLTPGLNIADVTGCVNLSNAIRINKESCVDPPMCLVSGGSISTSEGETEITVCADDGMSDPIDFDLVGSSGISMWLLTDSVGEVIETFDGSTIDFEGSDEGRCLVVHAAVRDSSFVIAEGDNTNDLMGCFSLSNTIVVNKQINCAMDTCVVSGGTISLADGSTEITICATDGRSDEFEVMFTDNVGANSIFLAADTTGEIIALQLDPFIDLEGVGEGVTLIYHLSARDSITGSEIGQNVNALQGCVALSNFITVTSDGGTFNGGTIQDANGNEEMTICDVDGLDAEVDLVLSGEEGELSIWLLTDDDGNIIQLFNDGPPFAIPDGSQGTQIWHLSYSSILTGLDEGANVMDFQGCFDLSNPFILIKDIVCEQENCPAIAAVISFDGGVDTTTVCVDDGINEDLMVNVVPGTGDTSVWLVTDTLGVILSLPSGPTFNFEGDGPGVCLLWNLTIVDTIIGLEIDSVATNIQGCSALSNSLRIEKIIDCFDMNVCIADGGNLTANGGQTSVTVCSGDGFPDLIQFELDSTVVGNSRDVYLLTDSMGIIINVGASDTIQFEGNPAGMNLVYHLAFTDSIMNVINGVSVDSITGCHDLSNPVEIIIETDCLDCPAVGGRIEFDNGTVDTMVCAGDGLDNILNINLTVPADQESFYVVTDTFGTIINTQANANFNFDEAGPDILQIQHLGFFGTVTGLLIGENVTGLEGCFAFSNPITVMRSIVDGGSVFSDAMATEITLCLGDGERDVVNMFNDSESNVNYTYLITDINNRFLATNSGTSIDLSGLTPGRCRIFGVSHTGATGDFLITTQQDVTQVPIASCFELSNNFIQLNRVSGDNCPDTGLQEPTVSFVALGNPADEELILQISSGNVEGPVKIELNDANGKLMMSESMNLEIGVMTKSIDVSSLQSGVYYATIRHPWIVLNERIVVQH